MFQLLALLLAAIILAGCSRPKKDKDHASQEDKKYYTHVSKEDPAMNAAIAQAKATTADFVLAFHARPPDTGAFAVKKPYPTPSGGFEHMWISVLEEEDGAIKGTVDNDAEETKVVKDGDAVTLKLSEISDWKYQVGHKLIGGYTIRYFLDRMAPGEREAFLKETKMEL